MDLTETTSEKTPIEQKERLLTLQNDVILNFTKAYFFPKQQIHLTISFGQTVSHLGE